MADKNIRLKTASGDNLYPVTKLSNIVGASGGDANIVTEDELATVAKSGLYSDLSGAPGVMTGATSEAAGTSGLVPAPAAGTTKQYLAGDGSFSTVDEVKNKANINEQLSFFSSSSSQFTSGTEATWYRWKKDEVDYEPVWYTADLVYDGSTGHRVPLVAEGKGKLVALCTDRSSSTVWASCSYDGVHWSYKSLYKANAKLGLIAGGDKGFIVAPTAASTSAFYSEDGITWTEVTLPVSHAWTAAAYGNGTFVLMGTGTYAYSTNGTTWTSGTLTGYTSYKVGTVAYGGSKFVALPYSSSTDAFYSSNGVTWTHTTVPSSTEIGSRSIAYGNGKFIAGSKTKLLTSTNGTTWTESTPSFSFSYGCAVVFCEGKFIAFPSYSKKTYISTDGSTWEQMTFELDNSTTYTYLTYGLGRIYATTVPGTSAKFEYSWPFTRYYLTLDRYPTTSSKVFQSPNLRTNLTISSSTSSTITIGSYTYTYTDNPAIVVPDKSVVNPNYICFVDDKGIYIDGKKYSTILPDTTAEDTGKALIVDSSDGSLLWKEIIPSEGRSSGKFLHTTGYTLDWQEVLPNQYDEGGKFLTTNGSTVSWGAVREVPSAGGNNGKFLYSNGSDVVWTAATITAPVTERFTRNSEGNTIAVTDHNLDDIAAVHVYKNGIRLTYQYGSSDTNYDYTITKSSDTQFVITFAVALTTSDVILVDMFYNKIVQPPLPAGTVELVYPFTGQSTRLANVTGGSYPFVIDSTHAALMSGATSYNINNGTSWGYFSFTTPNRVTTLNITGYASCENNWDFGACVLSRNTAASIDGVAPTANDYVTKIKNATIKSDTTDLAVGSPIVVFRSTGENTTSSSAAVTLAENTTYYLHLVYKKDGSGNKGDDRFYISYISFVE